MVTDQQVAFANTDNLDENMQKKIIVHPFGSDSYIPLMIKPSVRFINITRAPFEGSKK